jgi:1-phosphofructokinase family hexose kinase
MILCLTPNPAIDRTLLLPGLTAGNVHRAETVIVAAGGKGLNVARAIHTLGGESLSMGFTGGHTGRLLADLAQWEGLKSLWTWVDSETRTCTILVPASGDATVINEPGLPVSGSDWERLREDMRRSVSANDLVCISGSWPPQSPASELQGLFEMLIGAARQVWVDTSGFALNTVLSCPGLCVKVNGNEIGASLGFEVHDVASAKRALMILRERGMRAAVITLGAAGALLATAEGQWVAQGPRVRVVSTVGSGDSFLGGLVHALEVGSDWPPALCAAMAAGTANTLSVGGGKFTLPEFESIKEQIQIQTW